MAETLLHRTPLYDLHLELGAKMVPFAGYEMPVQYEGAGVMAEHNHTRTHAGLFDVSHMGQARITGDASALEALTTLDIGALGPNQQKYTLLLNPEGGIMDDLMVSRPEDDFLFVVVNAATKGGDFAYMRDHFGRRAELIELDDRALLALQGPEAVAVMEAHCPGACDLKFMEAARLNLAGHDVIISRSGYTGEDGFEISVLNSEAEALSRTLLGDERVKFIGLGARDSLRLEAGLCLYGHDMDETVTPIEASLTWAVAKSRRARGDFPGARRILKQIEDGADKKRVGIVLNDKAPAREGTEIQHEGETVGVITSGGFGPTVGGPIAMGYVRADLAKPGTALDLMVRGKARPAEVVKTPFSEHRFFRG